MINLFRRIGFSLFKKSPTKSRAAARKRFYAEPLEPKQLLAADLGIDLQDASSMARFALLHALSRGRGTMVPQEYSVATTQINEAEPIVETTTHDTATPISLMAETASPSLEPINVESINVESINVEPITVTTETAPVTVKSQQAVLSQLIEQPIADAMSLTTTGNTLTSETEFVSSAEGAPPEIDIQVGEISFVIYNPDTGEVRVDTSEGATTVPITTLEINSKSGIFTGDPAINVNTQDGFDVDTDTKIFKLSAGGFPDLTFGNVAQLGLSEDFIFNDIFISGSFAGNAPVLSSEDVTLNLVIEQNGNPVNTLQVGAQFDLVVTAQDTRFGTQADQEGVFASYMDILFDTSLATLDDITYGANYPNGQTGSLTQDGIDEIGAFSNSNPIGRDPIEVFRVTMTAESQGTLTFTADPADNLPLSETLLFGSDTQVPENRINFDSVSATVTDTPEDQDLVAFAKALADSGAVFYGASWCPHCRDQKEAFEDGQDFLPFVEVTNYETSADFNSLNQIGIDNNITSFPTWVFADNSRETGFQTLEQLSTLSGIAIPTTNVPTLIGLEDTTVLDGSPLHIPLNGWDANGGELTYTVTSDNPTVVAPELIDGGRSMLINIDNNGSGAYGKMLFHLFEDQVPRVTDAIIGLAESGTYDDVIFHRVIDGFMIQGGDPTGTGFGDDSLPLFDDQFNVDLQHNRSGVLSMAKSDDDTNSSQFFITETPRRSLDFNHSIFGQLVEGDKNREAISNAFTITNPETGAPDFPSLTVNMESVTIDDDIENSMVLLRAGAGQTGSANITVTVTDEDGHSFAETFAVNVEPDTINNTPFLRDIPELSTTVNTPLTFNLDGVDVEGNSIFYGGNVSAGTQEFNFEANSETGEITITPPDDFVGILEADFFAGTSANSSDSDSVVDYQRNVQISVNPSAPIVDLRASTDTGLLNDDNVTVSETLDFDISNLQDGTTVELFLLNGNDETKIGEAVGDVDGVLIQVDDLENGVHVIVARQKLDNQSSLDSEVLAVTIDRQEVGNFSSTPPTAARVSEDLAYDADHPIEGDDDVVYALVGAPSGATINPDTGVVTWLPSDVQLGIQTFTIQISDLAGNTAEQQVSVEVDPNTLVAVRLEVTDAQDNVIEATRPGLQYILKAYVDDLRLQSSGDFGVTSAYFDVEFNGNLTSLAGATITFSDDYSQNQLQNVNTSGLFDETGAESASNLGQDEVLLWTAVMTADALGTVTFSGNIAEDNDFELAGFTETIAADKIVFTDVTLQIVDILFAQDDTITVDEDSGTSTLDVLGNDLPADNSGVIAVVDVTTPANGSAVITTGGEAVDYTPNDNFSGTDSFTYTIEDEQNTQSEATVTVNVTGINDTPVAVADSVDVDEDSTDNVLPILDNDTDVDSDPLTIAVTSNPSNGTLVLSNNSDEAVYTPNANFFGTDTFEYTVNDGTATSTPVLATINVLAENDPPVVVGEERTIKEDATLSISDAELLENDNPGANENDTLTIVNAIDPVNGTVTRNNGQIVFTPDANFFGTGSFEYIVTDGLAQTNGTVTITITPENDPPVAVADTATTTQSAGTITIDVLANDTFAPDTGETLTILSTTIPDQGGTVVIANGELSYTPPSGFSGTETFSYTITDRDTGGLNSTATVTITVQNFVTGGLKGRLTAGGTNNKLSAMIRFQGTDKNGNAVDQTVKSAADGTFTFDEVAAGTYTVSADLPFTLNANGGSNSVEVEITDTGLGDQTIELAENYINPKFAMWEMTASATRAGIYAAVDTSGGNLWTRNLEGWTAEIVDMVLSADLDELTITVDTGGGNERTTSISIDDRDRVKIIGAEGTARLVRILGPQASFFPANGG